MCLDFSCKGDFKKYVRSKPPIFDPPSPSCLSLFLLHVPSSTCAGFSVLALPLPLSQKTFRDVYKFSNEKSGSEKRGENWFFCWKLSIKNQCFLYIYIYNENKNIYKFIKKNVKLKKKKKSLRLCNLCNKKTPLYAGLSSKQ